MKKFYKIAGIIAGITAAVGLTCCLIGAALGANAVIAYSKEKGFQILEEKETTYYENMNMDSFSSIYVDTDVAEIKIVESAETEKYGVKCQLAGSEEVTQCKVENNSLVISTSENVIQFSLNVFGLFSSTKNQIIIYVPRGEILENIDITSDVGEIKIDSIIGAISLKISADVGDIEIKGGEYGTVDINANVGDIKASDMRVAFKLDVYSDVGDVELDGNFACNMNVETSVGDIEIETDLDASKYDYSISTSAGDVEAFGNKNEGGNITVNNSITAEYKMQIKTDIGDVEVN